MVAASAGKDLHPEKTPPTHTHFKGRHSRSSRRTRACLLHVQRPHTLCLKPAEGRGSQTKGTEYPVSVKEKEVTCLPQLLVQLHPKMPTAAVHVGNCAVGSATHAEALTWFDALWPPGRSLASPPVCWTVPAFGIRANLSSACWLLHRATLEIIPRGAHVTPDHTLAHQWPNAPGDDLPCRSCLVWSITL